MNFSKDELSKFLGNLTTASQETAAKADRPIVFDGAGGLRTGENVITVFASANVYERTATFGGQTRALPIFAASYFDKDGNHITNGEINAGALSKRYYKEDGNGLETNEVYAISNWKDYNVTTPLELVRKCVEQNLCVQFVEKQPLYNATFDNALNAMVYDGMQKGSRSIFKIVPIPENVKTQIA